MENCSTIYVVVQLFITSAPEGGVEGKEDSNSVGLQIMGTIYFCLKQVKLTLIIYVKIKKLKISGLYRREVSNISKVTCLFS